MERWNSPVSRCSSYMLLYSLARFALLMALSASGSAITLTLPRSRLIASPNTCATACFSSSRPVVVDGVMKAMPCDSRCPAASVIERVLEDCNTWLVEQPASASPHDAMTTKRTIKERRCMGAVGVFIPPLYLSAPPRGGRRSRFLPTHGVEFRHGACAVV